MTAKEAISIAWKAVESAGGRPGPLQRRDHETAVARHAVLWVARRLAPKRSLAQLGKAIGGMDHTSVAYAILRVERDPERRQLAERALRIALDSDAVLEDRMAAQRRELARAAERLMQAAGEIGAVCRSILLTLSSAGDRREHSPGLRSPSQSQAQRQACSERGCVLPTWRDGLCRHHWSMFNDDAPFLQQESPTVIALRSIG